MPSLTSGTFQLTSLVFIPLSLSPLHSLRVLRALAVPYFFTAKARRTRRMVGDSAVALKSVDHPFDAVLDQRDVPIDQFGLHSTLAFSLHSLRVLRALAVPCFFTAKARRTRRMVGDSAVALKSVDHPFDAVLDQRDVPVDQFGLHSTLAFSLHSLRVLRALAVPYFFTAKARRTRRMVGDSAVALKSVDHPFDAVLDQRDVPVDQFGLHSTLAFSIAFPSRSSRLGGAVFFHREGRFTRLVLRRGRWWPVRRLPLRCGRRRSSAALRRNRSAGPYRPGG
jgi:hypothetical protein